MGLAIESKTVNREKRYMGFSVTKNKDSTNQASVTVATGYYDTFDGVSQWVTEKEEYIHLNNDQLTVLFNIKASALGLTAAQSTLFAVLDTALYGVIAGQIPINYVLTTTVKVGTDVVSDYSVNISKGGNIVYSAYATDSEPVVIKGTTLLGTTVTVNKAGYIPYTKTYTAMTGPIALAVTLEPVVVETPPAEG